MGGKRCCEREGSHACEFMIEGEERREKRAINRELERTKGARFTSVMQHVTRMKDMTREDEIEDALPSATGRWEKRTLLQFWSGVEGNQRIVNVP